MRVLFVIDSMGASGTEHSTAALMSHLRCAGHVAAAATLYDAGFGDEDRLRAEGYEVVPLVSRRYCGRVLELRRRIRQFRPQIVHTSLFNADMVGRVAAWHAGPVVVSSLVNTPYETVRLSDPSISTWKVRCIQVLDLITAHLMVDRLHAVSRGVAEANARALWVKPERISVVERGRSREALGVVSVERRARVRASLGLADDAKVVLAAGRQEHQKAHVDLVRAVEALAKQVPTLTVLLAGREGGASSALRECLGENQEAARCVTLLGHRHDVADLLVAADALAISSLFEGTAGVAIEAMALGCPIVCTDIIGVKGVLTDGENALLVPVSSPQALAEAIGRVLTDEGLATKLRTRGLADFDERFTIDVSATKMEELYADAIAAHRRRGHR